jgi:Dolichyl-phosphate-mannose-protein mannosyltransferase
LTEVQTEHDRIQRETMFVAWAALGLGLVSLAYCVRHGTLLLYGDAVAHLHIARRIFDSLTPGYRQLGSVWLPLPHLLLLPFVWNMEWWRTGLAGAFVSVPSYVLGCTGIYRLARLWLPASVCIVVAAFYGLNPGLLYMATTAMTEPLFLAEMIWAVLCILQFQRKPEARVLLTAGLVLVCAIFTRYDGWIFAAAAWCFATWTVLRTRPPWRGKVMGAWVLFTAMLIAAPSLWLAYNAKQFGDPLDFVRGPYSARAIEAKTTPPGSPPHPGEHNLRDAAIYFLKSAELGAAPVPLGKLLCWLSAAGTLAALWVFRQKQIWPALLLWLPLPFYAYSIAYGSVPIFVPQWRPYSWYNTRYGMELLPAFSLFLGALLAIVFARLRRFAMPIAFLLVIANTVWLLRARPIVVQEAVVNARTRVAFESALAKVLASLPERGLILMQVSDHVGALQQAAIPLRRTVNEGDFRTWQHALEDPARSVAAVVAVDGDKVAQSVKQHPEGLDLYQVVCSTGQPCARIYRSRH